MTKWTMIHKSKRSAKKEWNRRLIIKHITALSISPRLKALHASGGLMLLFLAYADFILHHHLPDKQEVESFKELKDCRRRTNFIPGKQTRSNGEEDAPKALFLEYDNIPALMWQLDQQHHASYHHQWSPSHTLEITQHVESAARQGTTWGVNVSLDPNKVPNAAEVSLLAKAIK